MSSLAALNAQYLAYLAKYPLLTKSVTAGILGALNEIIASVVTGDVPEITLFGDVKVKNLLTKKTIGLAIYGFCLLTPISHYMYGIINEIFAGPPSTLKKVLQILTSLLTVTSSVCAVYTSWVGLLNNYVPGKAGSISGEVANILNIIKVSMKTNYLNVYKTSFVTSGLSLIIAQKYLPPQLWVVFFSVVGFVVGTFQNAKMKRRNMALRKAQEKKD
ncbi:Mpv17/PMP22 family protein [Kocuria palustris]|nr:Mpv17/PMP22 family protein [Kocuria palustris]